MKSEMRLGSGFSYYLQLVLLTGGAIGLTVASLSGQSIGGSFSLARQMPSDAQPTVLPSPEAAALTEAVVLTELMQRIILQESAGEVAAVNPDSGALGLGQVMPENLPHWSQEALGHQVSVEEFLASADVQQQIIGFKLAQYWEMATAATSDLETACRMVASTWYSGDPDLYQHDTPQLYAGEVYPSIADYTLSVCRGFEAALADVRAVE